jgi:predicted RND superfamily exporter protein
MLQKFVDMTWEDFDDLFEIMEQTDMTPDTIALHDIESNWIESEKAPNNGFTDTVFFMFPALFDDLQVNALSFLSEDYRLNKAPKESLIILQVDFGENYEDISRINNEIVERIQELDKQRDYISIEVTGEGVISSQIDEVTSEANQVIGPSIFIIIMFILLITFRQPSYVALPMLALGISTIWLFGTMSLLGIAFSVIAVALVPLIMGLGVDYSVHLFHNYRAELEKNRTPAQAIKRSVKEIGTAMFLAMITTVIAFMSFLSASVPPIRDFGILLGLGVTYTFITAITLLASTRYILDRRKKVIIKHKKRKISIRNIMGKTSEVVLCHQKKVLIIMILISLVMVTGAIQIKRGFDMDQFIPADNPALQLFERISEDFPYSSQDQEYILIEGNVATVEALKGIAKTHSNLENDQYVSRNIDGSTKTTSVYTVIQNAIKNNRSLIETYNIDESTSIPRTDKDVHDLFDHLYTGDDFSEIPSDQFDISQFSGIEAMSVLFRNNSRYESTLIRIYIDSSFLGEEGDIQDDLEVLKRELNDDIETYGGATALATGNLIIQLTITDSLTTSQILSTAISLILAAFVIILVYRNPTLGIITMIPVVLSIVWILGMMYYLGYILNVMTVTVTSITIGIGVDYAIHATERFRLVADKTGDITKAVCETISHTGGALLIAALTTALGFGILVFAPIPPQQQFGTIIAITIVFAFLTSVLLLPLMLERWARWRKKRKGYIISPGPPEDEVDSDEYRDYTRK